MIGGRATRILENETDDSYSSSVSEMHSDDESSDNSNSSSADESLDSQSDGSLSSSTLEESSDDLSSIPEDTRSSRSGARKQKQRKVTAPGKNEKGASRRLKPKVGTRALPSDGSPKDGKATSIRRKTSKRVAGAKTGTRATAKKSTKRNGVRTSGSSLPVDSSSLEARIQTLEQQIALQNPSTGKSASHKKKRSSKVSFKRIDEIWDKKTHRYQLKETEKEPDSHECDKYSFTVRRQFDNQQTYIRTVVDVRADPLKRALQDLLHEVRFLSLAQGMPQIDASLLFLFLEDIRAEVKRLTKVVGNGEKRKEKNIRKAKTEKDAATTVRHIKALVEYLDTDFAETKKNLYPLLKANTIEFDLVWALYKPNTIVCMPSYGDSEQIRAFRVDYSNNENTPCGPVHTICGRYLDYDGKTFGMATIGISVPAFRGFRPISSLNCYPLNYHPNSEEMKSTLIERGKKFVMLRGMNYRHHQGMAYRRHKHKYMKYNINGRIIVDPLVFRRINPNYSLKDVESNQQTSSSLHETCTGSRRSVDSYERDNGSNGLTKNQKKLAAVAQLRESLFETVTNEKGEVEILAVDRLGKRPEKEADELQENRGKRTGDVFTEEELLIATPVVVGFSFGEKQWLEFSVSGLQDIVWNAEAYGSLVIPESHKSIVKSLVTSHKFSAAKNIDDVIAGKGRGLVAVLHGPPGTGKTLTAEGIAELLRCPLYMVSAGELGTDHRVLEQNLNDILDVAHAWGAVLLLDEADVFLEKRSISDIHRNALVSIFLRLLEYFQGILFLTTNRVETFDEAFQSRIHIALRYNELSFQARKNVWATFIGKIQQLDIDDVDTSATTTNSTSSTPNVSTTTPISGTEADCNPEPSSSPVAAVAAPSSAQPHHSSSPSFDFDVLARHKLNGRQIKNSTRAAQALALDEGKPLSMSHILRVLEVARSFEQDLKGGSGYEDAMRSYT